MAMEMLDTIADSKRNAGGLASQTQRYLEQAKQQFRIRVAEISQEKEQNALGDGSRRHIHLPGGGNNSEGSEGSEAGDIDEADECVNQIPNRQDNQGIDQYMQLSVLHNEEAKVQYPSQTII